MSQSVDTKIVELKFNNDNFSQKVDSTLNKLEQLNKEIKQVGLGDALKNFNRSVKDVDMRPMTKGIEEVNKGFSKMEVVGITAIANIANTAVNMGKKIASKLIDPLTRGVMQGGLSRARNIEQATFQFEGQKISKSAGNESLSYYKEVMDAVLGTSYSYDVAAKAASQLAASNVGVINTERKLADGTTITAKTLDDSMTKALLGIAGVAAMTGSDFDSISQIFTRVAGQGRVMANDLNSIASRGLNAAAVLANYLGKTEEEVRDMVSKGKVSFKDFSDAMSEAFGAHAKDSTLMFQGALDDVNAALARIGADFYGPALNAGRDILNSITPLVDAIHTKLNPALDVTNGLMAEASKKLSQYLDMLSYMVERADKFGNDMGREAMGGWIEEHMNAWTNIADLYKRGDVKAAIDGLQEFSKADEKLRGTSGNGIDGRQMIADYYSISKNVELLAKYLGISKDSANELIEEGKIGTEEVNKVIDKMIEDGTIGFNEFYKSFHKLWSESTDLMNMTGVTKAFDDYIRACIRAQDPTERFNHHIDTFFTIIKGAKSLLSSFSKIFFGLGDIFLTLARHLAPLGHTLLIITEDFANFIIKLADFVATSRSFSKIIDSLVKIVNKIFDLVSVSKIAELAVAGLNKAFEAILFVVDKIASGFQKVIGAIAYAFGVIVDKVKSVISSSEEMSKVLQSLKNAGIVIMLINLADMLAQPAKLLDSLGKAIAGVGKSFGGMVENIGKAFESIAGLAGKVGAVIDEVRAAVYRMQQMLIATAILEIAFAIAVLAGAFYVLSKVPWEDTRVAAGAIISFLTIVGTLGALGKGLGKIKSVRKIWEKSVNDFTAVGLAFMEIAIAIGIIAGAIYMLAKLDTKQMLIATGAIEAIMITMALIARFLSGNVTSTRDTGIKALWSGKATETSRSMTKGLLGLVAMAEAIKIVAKALVSVATIADPEAMYNALAVIEALMWTMFAITKLLSGTQDTNMAKGIGGLLAMALAVRMLVKPIMELSAIAQTGSKAMWNAVGAIVALSFFMSMFLLMMSDSKGLVKAGVSIILMAKAIEILGEVVTSFASLDPEQMWQSIIGIAVGLGAMVLALALVDPEDVLVKAAAFVIMAKCLDILSGVVLAFGANNEQAWAGLGVAAIALLGLAGACYVFSKVPVAGILKLFVTLALGVVLVAAFGAAVGVLGTGLGILGVGLTILASSLAALTPVMGTFIGLVVSIAVGIAILASVGLPAAGVILVLALAFVALGAGMLMIGTGLSDMAAAIKILHQVKDDLADTTEKITEFVKSLKNMSKDAEAVGESFMSIAKPLKSIRTSAETITEQIEKMSSSYTELVQNSSDCIASLADSLTTITKLNQDSFASAAEAVKGFINSLKDISKDTETVANTAADISGSLTTLKEAFKNVNDIIDNFKKRSVNVFDDLGKSLSNIAQPIQILNNIHGELESLAQDLIIFVENLTTMKDSAATVSEGATAISDALKQIGEAATAAKDGFEGLTKKTANILEKMGTGLTAIADGFTKIVSIKDQLEPAASSISDFYNKLSELNTMSADIAHGTEAVASAVKTLGKAAEKTARLSKTGMSESGSELVNGLVDGIGANQQVLETKVSTVIDSAAQKARGKYNAWKNVGVYLVQGMINGINSKIPDLRRAVEKLEELARRAIEAKAEISSPSRVWMRIGGYMGEGLAIGIAKSGDQVAKASEGLASASEMAVRSAIESISDAISNDMNTAPVITPVVDLTNVRSSAAFISSAFGSSMLSAQGNSLAASITHTIQNGGKSDVERSIDDLTDQIGTMTDTMNSRALNNYITIDGASDPEAFADGLIRSFRLNARTV